MSTDAYTWIALGELVLSWVTSGIIATWKLAGVEAKATAAGDQATAASAQAIETLRLSIEARIDSLRERSDAQIEAKDAVTSRARHDLANQMERVIAELRANLRDTDARHAVLDREAIRKVDLTAFESRLSAQLAAHEGRITAALAAIDARREADFEKLERRFGETIERFRPKA